MNCLSVFDHFVRLALRLNTNNTNENGLDNNMSISLWHARRKQIMFVLERRVSPVES